MNTRIRHVAHDGQYLGDVIREGRGRFTPIYLPHLARHLGGSVRLQPHRTPAAAKSALQTYWLRRLIRWVDRRKG
jgi:hypothetical protein